MDINLQKLEALLAAVDTGSITAAGEKLSYSQSGVSRMIGDLEREWGVNLLERDKRGVRLTSDGERLIPRVRAVCQEYARLMTEVDDLHGLRTGKIRIGTFSSIATHYLPDILRAFRRDYPGMEYELLLGDYTEIEDWIRTGRVDLGFLRLPTDPQFSTRKILQDELMAILPEGHSLAEKQRVPASALCDEPFMLLEKGARAEVSNVFEREGLKPNVVFTTWDDYAVLSMVESGLGLSILPSLILQRIDYHVAIRGLEEPAYRDIGVAWKGGEDTPLAVERFLSYLHE
ncbi:MAG: LysR family transcriptional regulator [Acutalibacteraceae bacterium]|nr:LysR family transcriptional regulator [Acutalibacteraceae bacterium]